jgi:hypothetical protein
MIDAGIREAVRAVGGQRNRRPLLAFLHTAAASEASFGALVAERAPDVLVRHRVCEALLVAARRAGGVDAALSGRVSAEIEDLVAAGARVVVCTCSTLGAVAEELAPALAPRAVVQRIDRAMADRAAALALAFARGAERSGRASDCARRIVALATLESTAAPTCALLEDAARRAGARVEIALRIVEGAWQRFERGDLEGYAEALVSALREAAPAADVLVLAQGSMAAAAERCGDLGVPVLASPRLGVEAALAALADRA